MEVCLAYKGPPNYVENPAPHAAAAAPTGVTFVDCQTSAFVPKVHDPSYPVDVIREVNAAKQPPNPKTLMGNRKVPNFSVVPSTALIQEARAMAYGAYHSPRADGGFGYGPFNWRDSKIEYMTYVEAAVRHIMAAADREDIDPETGDFKVPHLALARATLGILIDALEHGTVIDNRPANACGRTAELLRELKKNG